MPPFTNIASPTYNNDSQRKYNIRPTDIKLGLLNKNQLYNFMVKLWRLAMNMK